MGKFEPINDAPLSPDSGEVVGVCLVISTVNFTRKYPHSIDEEERALPFQCPYCGALMTYETSQLDHIIPVSRGGPDNEVNRVRICISCNKAKRDRLLFSEWLPPSCRNMPEPDPEIIAVWHELTKFKACTRKLTAERFRKLKAALKRHSYQEIYRVGAWIASSNHPRAVFVRQNYDVDTLLVASRLQSYVELSQEPEVPPMTLPAFNRWRELVGHPVEPTPLIVAPILAAIFAIGEEDTIAIIEWALCGTDKQAKFLQEKNIKSLPAILRADRLHGRCDIVKAVRASQGAVPGVTHPGMAEHPDWDGIMVNGVPFTGKAPTDHLRRR